METEKIKYEIWRRRPTTSMASIGRRVGVTRMAVLLAVERKIRSPRIAIAIAEAIERPLVEVFPEFSENEQRGQAQAAPCN